MIYTYHYLSTMTGEPTPFFSICSALYGTQAPQNVDEIQTLIEN